MPHLPGHERVDEGGDFVHVARKILVADGQSVGRREKGEDSLNPVKLPLLLKPLSRNSSFRTLSKFRVVVS